MFSGLTVHGVARAVVQLMVKHYIYFVYAAPLLQIAQCDAPALNQEIKIKCIWAGPACGSWPNPTAAQRGSLPCYNK